MGYSTEHTQWPFICPSEIATKLIDDLFALLDDSTEGAGHRLGADIFSSDGVLISPSVKAEGEEAIRKAREHAWKVVKARRHTILRGYAHDETACDLMLIGNIVAGLFNGKEVSGEFTARVLITETESKGPRIKLFQTWMDLSPIAKALHNP